MASTVNSLALQQQPASAAAAAPRSEAPAERHLYGRVADFLLLGGSSLILFPLMLALPAAKYQVAVGVITLVLANFINNPHFAHSYQIFYRGFLGRFRDPAVSREMRIRYAVSGIVVPLLLVAFLGYGVVTGNLRLVALGGNVMALFVGWHYVKQGYGMLMVDAVLKRRFFAEPEKKLLLVNAYTVWGASWLFFNAAYSAKPQEAWGIHYFTFAVPRPLLVLAGVAVAATTLATARMLWTRHASGKRLPVTGLTAYAITLYLWILFVGIDPLWLLVVPALHSLQYLAVVYRFQTNVALAKPGTGRSALWQAFHGHRVQLTIFAMLGIFIGAAIFWLVPDWLDASVAYDKQVFGPALFLFVFLIFVNVHHYFMDSVMWRRGNPETARHLFS